MGIVVFFLLKLLRLNRSTLAKLPLYFKWPNIIKTNWFRGLKLVFNNFSSNFTYEIDIFQGVFNISIFFLNLPNGCKGPFGIYGQALIKICKFNILKINYTYFEIVKVIFREKSQLK